MQLIQVRRFVDIARDYVAELCPSTGLSLDIGCGDGRYHDAFPNQVVGLDRASLSRDNRSIMAAMENIPFKGQCFEFVTCFQAMYYSDDLSGSLRDMHRVTKQRATLLVSVSKPRAIEAHEDPSGAYQSHDCETWIQLFGESGFMAERLLPSWDCRLLFTKVRARRLLSVFSPYFWFLLRKAQ